MPELRWILLAAGVIIILGLYFYGRYSERRQAPAVLRREPRLQPGPEADGDGGGPPATATPVVEPEPEGAPNATDTVVAATPDSLVEQPALPLAVDATEPPVEADTGKQKIIVVRVAARGSIRFGGPEVLAALRGEGLEHGARGIFHRRELTGGGKVFSVANMVEPGSFDVDNLETMSTPGLTLFMILPGPSSPVAAFTDMLSTARRLAASLEAEVLDENGSTLSRQAASHLREQIIDFSHRVR